MKDLIDEHLEYLHNRKLYGKKHTTMDEKQLTTFILEADKLTREYNGLHLGEIYMRVLQENFPEKYNSIKETELDVSLYRENLPNFFKFLMK